MADIIFIGGFGSNPGNIADTVKALSRHYGRPVTAYTFRQAQRQGSALRQQLTGAEVITHSAGMLLLADAAPATVLAIAPPRRMSLPRLTGRFIVKERRLLASRRLSALRRRRIDNFYRWALHEHLLHPRRNLLMAPRISHFDAVETGRQLAAQGAQVNLVFFTADSLFWPETVSVPNLTVVTSVEGQHDELLVDPISVLNDIYARLNNSPVSKQP